ncbi:MAG: hypothetical protein E7568_01885 [Ruminococcaceae bacterium]|nr:hypothetical protein [Oscillospiraceae bacterium]
MVLIGVSSFIPQKSQKTNTVTATATEKEYVEFVQSNLKQIVKEISGDKSPKVFVTLETGIRREYAGETQDAKSQKTDENGEEISDDKKIKTITVKTSDGSESAVTVIEYMPQIRGVAIVCDGGQREEIREKIISAVTASLNITSKRVSVTGGQTQ